LSQFCRKIPAQFTIRPGKSLCKIFRIPLCQLTAQRRVVGEHRGKLRKEEGQNGRKEERKNERKKERKKERIYPLTQSVKLTNPKYRYTRILS
jgi:hypothetical protein